MVFNHVPVMPGEVISSLDIKPGGIYIDCTVGGGGHSRLIAEKLSREAGGRLIGIDQDESALKAASQKLSEYNDVVTLVHSNFSELGCILTELGVKYSDGILIDLGVSSCQLDTPERGFSYMHDAPLDMRMDKTSALSAYDIVNGWSEAELAHILFEYGEERFSKKIASEIVKRRQESPIKTTLELVKLCRDVVPSKFAATGGNPAKRTFQAIRIAVNGELDVIEPVIDTAVDVLSAGGRLSVITFHSLEDRIVKKCFAEYACGCTCPPDFPVCVCGHKKRVMLLTKKPVVPSEKELRENSRSHSAKLRTVIKL